MKEDKFVAEDQDQSRPLIDPNIVKLAPAQEAAEQERPQAKKKPTAAQLGPGEYCWGTGRRKTSVARVRIRPGEGNFTINRRAVDDYFSGLQDQQVVRAPLVATDSLQKYDVFVIVQGGGTTGQAGAVVLGLARALTVADPVTFDTLRDNGYLTRDARMVERKKYGQKGARKRFQFSKR